MEGTIKSMCVRERVGLLTLCLQDGIW